MVLLRKNNGRLRVCVHYWKLNANIPNNHFPLSFMSLLLEEVGSHIRYISIDGCAEYNQKSIALTLNAHMFS